MLKEQIQKDINEAAKNKEELRLQVLRMLSAAILNREKEKRYKISKEKQGAPEEDLARASWLIEEGVLETLFSEVKKRKEAIIEFKKGNREDLVKKEEMELEILRKYLPEQLSEEEIKRLAKEAIAKVGAKEPKDIGRAIAELMPRIKGKAEGGDVSRIIKELLASPHHD